jgi:penicillin-binding protein 2
MSKRVERSVEKVPSGRSNRGRILQQAAIVGVALLCLSAGLFNRQVIQSGKYEEQHERQVRHATLIPASRGRIFDRNGFVLADNRVKWSVNLDLGKLRKAIRAEQRRIIASQRAASPSPSLYRPDIEKVLAEARRIVAQQHLDRVNLALGEPGRPASFRVNEIALARHIRDRRSFPFPLIPDLRIDGEEPSRWLARFVEQLPHDEDSALDIQSEIVRDYPNGELAAHILGYVKAADPGASAAEAQLRADLSQKHNLGANSFVTSQGYRGVAGIEQSFDDILAGRLGHQVWERNIAGERQRLLAGEAPRQGTHLNLSLDLRIQKAAEAALRATRDANGVALPGSAALIDIETGEILALASTPAFDPNQMSGRVSPEYYNSVDERGGWLNRATQGLYPAGSTFKLVTAIAGMRSRVVRHDEVIDCGPGLLVGNRVFPEHISGGYGPTDLEKMLIVSCNVWNYIVGLRTGPEALAAESRRLGLDQRLLISSHDGKLETNQVTRGMVVPDPEYKRRRGHGAWAQGDTANFSIGQGYMLTTPLHMGALTASIAGNRTRTNLTLIADPGRGLGIHGGEPLGLTAAQRRAFVDGMARCVDEGTAGPIAIAGLVIAAKTGTAEYPRDGRNAHLAWAVGFAPANQPRVAFVVCVEGEDMTSWGGATAGPVARAMLAAWAEIPNDEAGQR